MNIRPLPASPRARCGGGNRPGRRRAGLGVASLQTTFVVDDTAVTTG